jgi:hypothetical protein
VSPTINRIMRRALFVLMALATLSACGGGNEPATTTTTTPPSVTTSSITSTTLAPRATTTSSSTTTTDPFRAGGDTPEQAAEQFQNTWKASSTQDAKSWADQPAIDVMFRTRYSDAQFVKYEFQSCAPNAGFNNAMTCDYTYKGGSMHYVMSNAVGKWRVISVQFVAD